jgi:hypothetical protein
MGGLEELGVVGERLHEAQCTAPSTWPQLPVPGFKQN